MQVHVQVAVRAGGVQLAEGGAADSITAAQNGRPLAPAPDKPAKKGTPWLCSLREKPP